MSIEATPTKQNNNRRIGAKSEYETQQNDDNSKTYKKRAKCVIQERKNPNDTFINVELIAHSIEQQLMKEKKKHTYIYSNTRKRYLLNHSDNINNRNN